MRVMVCTPRFAPQLGGAETWTRAVAEGLVSRGHSIEVITRAAPGCENVVTGRLQVRRVAGGRRAFARAIARAILTDPPDAVVAQYSALPPAVRAARRAGIAVAGVVHDVYGIRERVRVNGVAGGIARAVGLEYLLRWRAPDAFLVPSRATGRALEHLARGRPVTVVPAGADHLRTGVCPLRRDPLRVVFVGRLVPSKGPLDLIAAMRMVRARCPGARAVIVGEGPLGERCRATAAGDGDGVVFAGRLDDAELDEMLRASAVLALPSTREGWGLAITEAAARGVPYVAYDIPAVREQHEVLHGGILVAPELRALAGALGDLLDDRDGAEVLGRRGRAAAVRRTWAQAAAVVEATIEDCVMRCAFEKRPRAARAQRRAS